MNFQQETKSLQEERLEQCPVCNKRMTAGRYVCSLCETRDNSSKHTPPLMASEPEFDPKKGGRTGGCVSCGPFREEQCHERMSQGLWLMCEIPDALDYLVVGKLEIDDLREYIGRKTTSRWNNKDSGIIDA